MRLVQLAALLALAPTVAFAQSPFDGKWQLDQEKSNFTGTTMKIEDAGKDAIKFVDPNFTTTVKLDGTKASTPGGGMVAMKKTGPDAYHVTSWFKGKEISQEDWTLSKPDTLTVHEYGIDPDGQKFEENRTYTRAPGQSGLAGEWKTTSVKLGNPRTETMKLVGSTFEWTIPALKATLRVPTNGKDTHPVGPTIPPTLTVAVTAKDPHTLEVTQKLKGKTEFTGVFTVAADGRTLTVAGTNAKGEKISEVWNKQP